MVEVHSNFEFSTPVDSFTLEARRPESQTEGALTYHIVVKTVFTPLDVPGASTAPV